ncbi:iron-sulfur cluster-binding domain-containing protein [Acinetobacter sp. 187]|uniref:flavin reductase family protein n=1 Tax=Acinetobacter lanii TaxID=2715163 RepID=UPI00140D5CD2|nr:iron-sulfur cluster-binding domain-containing protein [Acinetobacter lanii]NHC03408.1 iron-sulfur cluster-binding domain-containing protein [Acinetobacter lanii]
MSSMLHYQPEWVREDFIDFIAEKVNPLWAWKRVKAMIVAIEPLSPDFFKIQLRPNQNFKSDALTAGQSILVTVVIAGVRQQRSYSVIEQLKNGDLIIAVRAQGIVSKRLTQMPIHQVVELSQPQGEFLLQSNDQSRLLIASGSGITAIYSLLKQALRQDESDSPIQIDLIYFSRDQAFHVELQQLAEQHPHFHYHFINTSEIQQHLDLELLKKMTPHFQTATTYACGAQPMMYSLNQIYRDLNLQDRLKQEYFHIHVDENLPAQAVTFLRAQQQFQADRNLLESAEQAGLRPAHGCRIGICNTCSCTKVSGSTKNIITGEIDHGNNTQIKLCVSQAVSPVVINL